MIVKAPRWKGTGLGKVRGLGQSMGPPELTVNPVTGEGSIDLTSAIMNLPSDLSNIDTLNYLSTIDTGITPSALSTALSPSSISGTTLAIIGGVLLFVILLGSASGGRR